MKRVRRFLFIAVILGAGVALLLKTPSRRIEGDNSEALQAYYDAVEAKNINKKDIFVYKNDVELAMEYKVFMSDALEVMAAVQDVNDLFGCSASAGEDGEIQISTGGHTLLFDRESGKCTLEGNIVAESACEAREGTMYVSVKLISQWADCAYVWDSEKNSLNIIPQTAEALYLPVKYDLRDTGRVTPVRDQGELGTCWAFSALAALESSLSEDAGTIFSVDHLAYNNGFVKDINAGGDYNMALAYMASWRGPVLETQDPYNDGKTDTSLSPAVHVQDAQIIDRWDADRIKEAVYAYGGVESAIYSDDEMTAMTAYYNTETCAYYYPDETEPNHDLVIVGWDDNYPKENFSTMPENNGAFICKNSWGEGFGDNGYIYVSYEDANVGQYGIVYTNVEAADNYDHIYQSDLLGWTASIGYNTDTAWMANVYTAAADETLEAVGFYATEPQTYYDIYVADTYKDEASLQSAEWVSSGYLQEKGYYTAAISSAVSLAAGEKYAVVVRIRTTDSVHPVAIEYASNSMTSSVDIDDGEGFMSADGMNWLDTEENQECNICLKVFTDSRQGD